MIFGHKTPGRRLVGYIGVVGAEPLLTTIERGQKYLPGKRSGKLAYHASLIGGY